MRTGYFTLAAVTALAATQTTALSLKLDSEASTITDLQLLGEAGALLTCGNPKNISMKNMLALSKTILNGELDSPRVVYNMKNLKRGEAEWYGWEP